MQHLALKSGRPVKYHVEISPVREVTLVGAADLAYWQQQLDREGLTPADINGQAQILVIAAEMKFKGIRFRELSISVVVGQPNGELTQDAVFLVCAFNSARLFAFVERTFFSTPYYSGSVEVVSDACLRLAVNDGHGGSLSAGMSPDDLVHRQPLLDDYHGWEGPIYLPNRNPRGGAGSKLFFAKLGGRTRNYAFSEASDSWAVGPSRRHPVFQSLIDSGFTGREWIVRPNAAHAKSKTMPRSAVELQSVPV